LLVLALLVALLLCHILDNAVKIVLCTAVHGVSATAVVDFPP